MHERLDGPELWPHHKATVVAGNVVVKQGLGELHLTLHLVEQFLREHLEIDLSEDGKDCRRAVLGNVNGGSTIAP